MAGQQFVGVALRDFAVCRAIAYGNGWGERPALPMTKGKPLRILITDDNLSMRNAIRRVLEEVPNVEVCAVTTDGIEAVDAATALKTRPAHPRRSYARSS
jgi:hypothetical protein